MKTSEQQSTTHTGGTTYEIVDTVFDGGEGDDDDQWHDGGHIGEGRYLRNELSPPVPGWLMLN